MHWHKRPKKEFSPKKRLGKIHVYTGDGKGKTSAALGIAMRAAGHNMRVLMIQLFKGQKDRGELKSHLLLRPYVEIVPFGSGEAINLQMPNDVDKYFAQKALEFAREQMVHNRPDVLIFDEVNPALAHGLLDLQEFLDFLDNRHRNTEVILTGHSAPSEILNAADIVTVMRVTKGEIDPDDFEPRLGIEY
jgi:cob(I)alamin adenosyltransferase